MNSIIKGKSAVPYVATGRTHRIENRIHSDRLAKSIDVEIDRFKQALYMMKNQVGESVADNINESADIIKSGLLLFDEFYEQDVIFGIKQGKSAEQSIRDVGCEYAKKLSNLSVEKNKACAEDVRGLTRLLLATFTEVSQDFSIDDNAVIVADELSPQELALLDVNKINAIITCKGSSYSHTAIIAGNYKIPYVYGIDVDKIPDKKIVLVNGNAGEIILEPDKEAAKELLRTNAGKTGISEYVKNTDVTVLANISDIRSIDRVFTSGAEGVGLFRTEYLFMDDNPSLNEDEQFEIYKTLLEYMQGKKSVIRLADFGGDKLIDVLNYASEFKEDENLRGVELLLNNRDFLRTQLRALMRAGTYGEVIMTLPMVKRFSEIKEIESEIDIIANELEQENIEYIIPKLGAMIETPEAVMIAEELAKELQYFSIGTNDLTYHTLGQDRFDSENDLDSDENLAPVFEQIEKVINAAHRNDINVCVCGEMAANKEYISKLIEMGIDEISVSISKI